MDNSDRTLAWALSKGNRHIQLVTKEPRRASTGEASNGDILKTVRITVGPRVRRTF